MTRNPEEDRLLEHNYDGIQEYDNPMPGWWVYLFYATIVFAALYYFNVPGIGVGKGRIANYEREVAQWNARQEAIDARSPKFEVTDASLLALGRDPAQLATGKALFVTNCAPCHRPDGGGLIGPNLTDDFWIHGARPTDIDRTISQGVTDKGMPVWSNVLKPPQIAALAAYVLTLHGTHPPNPKDPQGVKVEEGSEPSTEAAADTGRH